MRLEELNPPYEGIDAERISQWVPPDAEVEPLHTVRMYLKNHPLLAERMRPLAWFLLPPGLSPAALETGIVIVAAIKIIISMAWFIVIGLNTTMGVAWHRFTAWPNIWP